jgi:predicted dehydrogenase
MVGWSEMPDARLVSICDIDEGKARAKAQAFNIPSVYADFRTMIERETLDAVDIVTPVGTHAQLTRIAADAGLHVSCQKPLTPTVREAEELIAYVGKRVRFMVHENYRFRPHYVQVRQWLQRGRIDEITGTKGTLIYDRDRLYLVGSDEPPVVFDLARNYQACFSSAVREFVSGLRDDKPFAIDHLDNLETLKLMEACYVAAGVRI